MNAGQILMQPPVGPASAAPASPALAPEDRHAGNFAGVLATMTSHRSAKTGEVGAGSRMVSAGTSTADTAMVIPEKQDTGSNGVAELQGIAAMAVRSEAADTDVSAVKEGMPETEKAEDGEMPQNVVLCTAGALVVAEQQINGRMPEQEITVAAQGNVDEIRAASAQLGDVPKPVPAPENPLQPVLAANAATAPVEPVVKTAVASSQEVAAEAPSEKVVSISTFQRSGVAQAVQAPAEAEVVRMPESHRSAGEVSLHRGNTAEQVSPPAVLPELTGDKQELKNEEQPQSGKVQVSSAVMVESPVNPAGKPVSPEQGGTGAGVAAEKPAETALGAAEAATFAEPATPASSGNVTVQKQLIAKRESNAVQLMKGPDTGQSTPMAEDTTAQDVPSPKVQAAVQPAEFRFSRSAAVEAALGGHDRPSGVRNQEQTVPMHETGLKAAGEQQMPDGAKGGSGGSDGGSTGGNPEGFIQQGTHLARPMQQNIPGTHQLFSVDAASATPLQAQQESTRPGSAGNIAGQVRDQLGSHEIKTGSEQITIRLSPEHLGDIKVNFRLEDQRLKVEIVTESSFAKESLLQHADMLKDSLARQNISMDKFEVTTGGGSSQGHNAQSEWRELARNRQAQQWLASGGYRTRTADEIQPRPAYLARPEHAVLDLHF